MIVEGESDWNDYDVCLSSLSSLYAKAEQVKEEKARSFVGKKKVWCSGWGKVPDPCSFVEVNPTTRFKNCRGKISWRGGEGGRRSGDVH